MTGGSVPNGEKKERKNSDEDDEVVLFNVLFHKQLKRLKRSEKPIITTKNSMVVLSLTVLSRK